jgi:recombination protein RecT
MSQIVPTKDKILTIRELFTKNKQQIQAALPRHLTVDRMIRVAFTSISLTPKLLDCTPRSLLGAVIQCAQLGLEPGVLGHVYLIPFKDQVQIVVGYKGLLKLARNTRELSTIYAHAVYASDMFTYRLGTDPKIEHVPDEKRVGEPGPPTHYYAVARLKDGGVQFEVMTRAAIEAHRDRYSRAAKQGPWVTEFDEMAKKTVLRRLCKVLPASIELQTAVVLDERAEVQLPQELPDVLAEGEAPVAGRTLDDLAQPPTKDTP